MVNKTTGSVGYLTVCALIALIFHAHSFSTKLLTKKNVKCIDVKLDLSTSSVTTFVEMKSMDRRLEAITTSAPSCLSDFYEPHLQSFSIQPGKVEKMSVTSTCYSLLTILSANKAFDSMFDSTKRQGILKALLESEWRTEDLFQVPLLLYTILKVDDQRVLLSTVNEQIAFRVRQLLSAVLSARPRRRNGTSQVYSDYILFQVCRAMSCLVEPKQQFQLAIDSSLVGENYTFIDFSDGSRGGETDASVEFNEVSIGGLPTSAIPLGASSQLYLGLARSAEVSFNELCRQLAYRTAKDSTSFDVTRLAYSLLIYVTATTSLQGTAGRELVPGQGPSVGTKTLPLNKRLITSALAAFFDEQLQNGLWDRGQPIYKTFRRQGRNVGNAFVFAVDTLGSLLEALEPEDFRPHLFQLKKTLDWIETHQVVEVIPNYCDPESGQCYGKPLCGWQSPHLAPDTGPQAWSTAQTLTCAFLMRKTIQKLMHNDVLREFNGRFVPQISEAAWERLLDSDVMVGNNLMTLKNILTERVIVPFETSVSNPSFGAVYSAILFGPPGTAKTTICESLAEKMGWDFVVIDTAAFLADGLTNVASRIRYVFDRLGALSKCIILFDEIEEFCLDRETPGLGMESRMLTTAMLTAINDLRRAKKSVFFLATNRLRAFDSAITRPGRFDIQLFVGTPNRKSRVILLDQKLVGIDEEIKKKAMEAYDNYLEEVWAQEAMFMNYLEGLQFATACANIVNTGFELTKTEMSQILKTQAAVMTVRGSVRDEFIASMELSRL
jgi:hypothetical protein